MNTKMKTFKELYILNESDLLKVLSAFIVISEEIIECTVGLKPIHMLFSIVPLGARYDLPLPGLLLVHSGVDFRDKPCPGGLLSIPLIPFVYAGSILGKLVGLALCLLGALIGVPITLAITWREYKKQNQDIQIATQSISESKINDDAENTNIAESWQYSKIYQPKASSSSNNSKDVKETLHKKEV